MEAPPPEHASRAERTAQRILRTEDRLEELRNAIGLLQEETIPRLEHAIENRRNAGMDVRELLFQSDEARVHLANLVDKQLALYKMVQWDTASLEGPRRPTQRASRINIEETPQPPQPKAVPKQRTTALRTIFKQVGAKK